MLAAIGNSGDGQQANDGWKIIGLVLGISPISAVAETLAKGKSRQLQTGAPRTASVPPTKASFFRFIFIFFFHLIRSLPTTTPSPPST